MAMIGKRREAFAAGGAGKGSDPLGGFDAVHLGHLDVHEDGIEVGLRGRTPRLRVPLTASCTVIPSRRSNSDGELAVDLVVLDEQHMCSGEDSVLGDIRWFAVSLAEIREQPFTPEHREQGVEQGRRGDGLDQEGVDARLFRPGRRGFRARGWKS